MKTKTLCLLAGCLAAWAAPRAQAQDEGPPRRFVPGVYSGRRVEQDEDHSQRVQGTLFKVLENLGDSINFSIFPVNVVVGDLELFMRKLDQELYTYGSDRSRYDLLHGDTLDNRHRGFEGFYRDVAQAYQKLVEKSMIPMAGEAGPLIKEYLGRVEPMVDKLEPDLQEIAAVNQEIERNVQAFQAATVGNPPQVQPIQAQRLNPLPPRAQQMLAALDPLDKDKIEAADEKVDQVDQGKSAAESTLQRLKSEADNIIDADNKAIQKASLNRARGGASSTHSEGATGPVLRMVLARLEEAVKKTEEAKKGTKKLTDKDESQGLLKKLHKALRNSIEKNQAGALAHIEGANRINDFGRRIAEAQDQPTIDDLKGQANAERERAQQAFRAAEGAFRPIRQQFQQTKENWRQVDETLLGKVEGGKSEIQGRLPYPLPMPPFRASAPKDPPSRPQTASQKIKSKAIKYPDALGLSTGEVMRQEGLQERGGTSNCRGGSC